MKSLRITAVCAALYLASASCIAGGAMEGTSTRPDLFFAWLSSADDSEGVVVNLQRHADFLRLTEHCKSGLPVYRYGQNTRYTCKAEPYDTGSPDSRKIAQVTVKGPIPKSTTAQFGMFSLKPTRTTRWNTRAITPDEQAALKSFIDVRRPRLRVPVKQLKLAAATVTFASDEERATLIVPGNEVRDEPGGYYAQQHYVFVKDHGAYAYRGMLPAKPAQYFDLDGGDLPDVLAEEDCDGICISLWSLSKGIRNVAAFGGH